MGTGPRPHGVVAWALCLLLALTTAAWPAQRPRYAIRAGKIVTITQGTIDHGVVLIRDGKIEALGPASVVAVPKGYALVDVGDRWVMPGMVLLGARMPRGASACARQ